MELINSYVLPYDPHDPDEIGEVIQKFALSHDFELYNMTARLDRIGRPRETIFHLREIGDFETKDIVFHDTKPAILQLPQHRGKIVCSAQKLGEWIVEYLL